MSDHCNQQVILQEHANIEQHHLEIKFKWRLLFLHLLGEVLLLQAAISSPFQPLDSQVLLLLGQPFKSFTDILCAERFRVCI